MATPLTITTNTVAPALTDIRLAANCIDNNAPRPGFESQAEPATAGRLVATIQQRDHGSAGTSYALTRIGAPGRGNTSSSHPTLPKATAAAEKWAKKRFALVPAAPVAEQLAPIEQPAYLSFVERVQRRQNEAEALPGRKITGLYELGKRAHSGTSFDPEKRAHNIVKEYQAELADHLAQIHAAGEEAGADAERIQAAADRYESGYVAKLTAWLEAKSRCISWMITGPSNFPTRRADNANRSEHNRMGEFIEFCEKNLARAIKGLKTPPTAQEQADKYAREAAELEKMQELMKAGNRIVKAAKGADCTAQLVAAGLSEKLAAEAQKVVYGRAGFPAWMLTNNLANIKRVKARAEEMAAKAATQLAACTEATAASARSFELNGQAGEVVINAEVDRVQLLFAGKPDADTITLLKRNGFKWSPRFTAWQRQDTPNGRHAVRQLTGVDLNAAPAPVAPVEQPAAQVVEAQAAPVQQPVAEWTQTPSEALELAAKMQAVELEVDFNRLVLLDGYHGPATAAQVQRLPDWHELKHAHQAAEQLDSAPALSYTPAEPAQLERGSHEPVQVGNVVLYHVAGRMIRTTKIDTMQYALEVNAAGDVRTEKDGWLRAGSFTHCLPFGATPRTPSIKDWYIFAAGYSWLIVGRPPGKEASTLTERQAKNGALRARRELERTQRDNAARLAKLGPLGVLLYGEPEQAQPRYTTGEEANAYNLRQRDDYAARRRDLAAEWLRRIRQKMSQLDAHTLAAYNQAWNRRTGALGLEYLSGFLTDLGSERERKQALAHYAPPASVADTPTPQPKTSQLAADGWHVLARPVDVAPEHAAQLEQLRELVQRLPLKAGYAPTLYQVITISEQIPAGTPFWAEARRDGLAIVYGTAHECAEVLRLAPAGEWPQPYTNYTPRRGPLDSWPAGPPRASKIPPSGAPRRVQIGRSWYLVHRPPLNQRI